MESSNIKNMSVSEMLYEIKWLEDMYKKALKNSQHFTAECCRETIQNLQDQILESEEKIQRSE